MQNGDCCDLISLQSSQDASTIGSGGMVWERERRTWRESCELTAAQNQRSRGSRIHSDPVCQSFFAAYRWSKGCRQDRKASSQPCIKTMILKIDGAKSRAIIRGGTERSNILSLRETASNDDIATFSRSGHDHSDRNTESTGIQSSGSSHSTSIVTLMLLVIIEVVPLQDPREGWSANGTYWARISGTAISASMLFLNQTPTFIPEVVMTPMSKIALIISAAAAFGSTIVLLAKYWMFPVPFALTLGSGPFFVAFSLIAVLTMGRKNKAQLRRFQHFMLTNSIQGSMIVVYPAYNAIFLSLDGIPQLALVVLLPIVKLSFKHLLAKLKMWDDDLLPSVFACVDIFDAMYMSKCMQSAGTLTVGVAIVAVDLAQNLMAIRKLSKQTEYLRHDLQTRQLLPYVFTQLKKSQRLDSGFLLTMKSWKISEQQTNTILVSTVIYVALEVPSLVHGIK
ncbi:hypothetical protein FI667_g16883, partial [Globisporangium splendens]